MITNQLHANHRQLRTDIPPRNQGKDPPQQNHKQSRANISIATLNINGCSHSNTTSRSQISKWTDVYRLIHQKQISILCLQETHLDHHHITDINRLFSKRIAVHPSINPNNPSASMGIAFVINKERLNSEQTHATEILPGQAMLLSIKWSDNSTLNILNVYAPNTPQNHPPFWTELQQKLHELHIANINIILGDFNITEDLFDRAPACHDDHAATEAL